MPKGYESYFVSSLGSVLHEDDFDELTNSAFGEGKFYRVNIEFVDFFHKQDNAFEVTQEWLEKYVNRGNVAYG